mmetsp:Transcript_45916/g.144049  ORF Transcript_45916/g.144049 Transcript_45916/m.144049 type:complete len:244 (+) Transcript_45916:339-1070(+)
MSLLFFTSSFCACIAETLPMMTLVLLAPLRMSAFFSSTSSMFSPFSSQLFISSALSTSQITLSPFFFACSHSEEASACPARTITAEAPLEAASSMCSASDTTSLSTRGQGPGKFPLAVFCSSANILTSSWGTKRLAILDRRRMEERISTSVGFFPPTFSSNVTLTVRAPDAFLSALAVELCMEDLGLAATMLSWRRETGVEGRDCLLLINAALPVLQDGESIPRMNAETSKTVMATTRARNCC